MLRANHRSHLRRHLDNGVNIMRCISTGVPSNQNQEVLPQYSSQESHLWFKGGYAKRFPPLSYPLPDLRLPPYLPDHVECYPTSITTLPNGLKIASENSLGPAACIGLFVDSGSIYESEQSRGVTHLLERMAFKSTKNRSHLRIIREIEATGSNVAASASREQMCYVYDTLKTYVPEAVELLIDYIRNPVFLESDVKEQLVKIRREIEEISNNPQQFLLESLNSAGYSGALGNPLMAPASSLDRIDGYVINKFYNENYTAERMVLAASGIEHEELLAIAEPLLYDLQCGPSRNVPKSVYIGGDFRHRADSQSTHVALAFEVPGGWHQEKEATALTVLQGSDFVAKAVEIAAGELLAVATPGQVTALELHQAKNATKSAALMNLESWLR